jgi:putative transposase
MKRLRFTEEQIIAVLREQEAGMKTADICRKHGIIGVNLALWAPSINEPQIANFRTTPRTVAGTFNGS